MPLWIVNTAKNTIINLKNSKMKQLFIALSICALSLSACTTQPAEGEQADGTVVEAPRKTGKKLRSESDSISYAVGIDLGNHLKNNIEKNLGKDYNQDMVFAAIKDVFADRPTLLPADAMGFIQEYFMVRIPARNKAEGEAFLAKVAEENPNIQKTESGLMYEIIEPGNDVKAENPQDRVRVLYTGTTRDGNQFDSTTRGERVDTAEFALNGVIKGWTEGLKLIGEGGKIKLWIPAELGYGSRPMGTIAPNEPLMFDMEVIQVKPAVVAE